MLGPCGPVNCWFVGANDRTRCRGVSHTPPKHPARDECATAVRAFGPFRGRQGRLPSLPGASAGVPASLSAFAVAFAQAARGLSAFAVAFAQAAQVSRHLPRRLRKRRKSLGVCRGVCAGSASLSAFARPGFLTALPRAGRWGVCWASSRRPTRGERRRRRGLHSARSAGC